MKYLRKRSRQEIAAFEILKEHCQTIMNTRRILSWLGKEGDLVVKSSSDSDDHSGTSIVPCKYGQKKAEVFLSQVSVKCSYHRLQTSLCSASSLTVLLLSSSELSINGNASE